MADVSDLTEAEMLAGILLDVEENITGQHLRNIVKSELRRLIFGADELTLGTLVDGEFLKRVSGTIVSGVAADADAIHDNVAAEISALVEKVTPVAADLILVEDSAAGNTKKKIQIGNLPSAGGGLAGLETPWRAATRYGAPRIDTTPQTILANTLYAYPVQVPSSVPINKIGIVARPVSGSFLAGTSIRMGVYSDGIALPVTLEANSEGLVTDSILTGSDPVFAEATLGTPPTLTRSPRWIAFVTNEVIQVQVLLSTGDRAIDLDLGKLSGTVFIPGTKATGTIAFSSNPTNGETFLLPEWNGSQITQRSFKFVASTGGLEPPFEVLIGASASDTRDNLQTKLDALILASTIGDFQPVSGTIGQNQGITFTQVVAGTGGNSPLSTQSQNFLVAGFSGAVDSAVGTRGQKHVNGVKVAFTFAALPATFPTPVTYIGDQDFIPHVIVEAQTDGAAV